MTLSPYTHPSMPGTSYRAYLDPPALAPSAALSAALEDAEGRALVEAIHDPTNPRLRNSHAIADDNRKLIGQIAVTVPAIVDSLGVTQHGSNGQEVP